MIPAAPLLLALVVGPVPTVTWTPAEPQIQTGFLIERADQSTCEFNQIGTATNPAFDDVTATLNVPVCYLVRAFNAYGVSARSNTACATPTGSGGLQDISQSFTFTGISATFIIDLGGFECVRKVGSTAKLYIKQAGTDIVPPITLHNPSKNTTFVMRCQQISTTSVNLYIDGVLKLSATVP